MTKHTPGKWRADKGSKEFEIHSETQYSRVGIWIGTIHWKQVDESTAQANSRLMASSPELLEALKYMVKWAERHGLTTGELITGQQATLPVIDMARKAIAKAEGEV